MVATVSYSVQRSELLPDGTWTPFRTLRVAQGLVVGSTFDDHQAAARQEYQYRVVAHGDNGTTSVSPEVAYLSGAVEGATYTPPSTETAVYDVAVYG